MRDRLPVNIENLELPKDEFAIINKNKNYNYGYVSILYLLSLIITIGSALTILFLGK